MSKIGYIRVSTEHQETARQQEIMCSYQVDRIFSEKLSGANTDRPQLRAMLDYVREGDTLYIESISRLGRSTKDLLNIIDTLTDKGVTLISHKEKIDTDTPAGKFMLTVFAALSQLEREQLKQRQREGIFCCYLICLICYNSIICCISAFNRYLYVTLKLTFCFSRSSHCS